MINRNQPNDELLTAALKKIDNLQKDIKLVCPPSWAPDVITLDKKKNIKSFEKILEDVELLKEIINSVKNNEV